MIIVDTHSHVSPYWYEPVESLLFQMDRHGVQSARHQASGFAQGIEGADSRKSNSVGMPQGIFIAQLGQRYTQLSHTSAGIDDSSIGQANIRTLQAQKSSSNSAQRTEVAAGSQ